MTYAGFESHANYYSPAELQVYWYQNATFGGYGLANVGGVWIADRTWPDLTRRFMPRQDNIIYVPTVDEIVAQVLPFSCLPASLIYRCLN